MSLKRKFNPLEGSKLQYITETFRNGFAENQLSNIDYGYYNDAGTWKFFIEPIVGNYNIHVKGEEFIKSNREEIAIIQAEGYQWFYFDTLGVLTSISNPTGDQKRDIVLNQCFISYGYWDNANKKFVLDLFDERHLDIMSPATHAYNHEYFGTQYKYGLGLANFELGNVNVDRVLQFSCSSGTIVDEDREHTIPALTFNDSIPFVYLEGANGYLRDITTAGHKLPLNAAGNICYNEWTGTTWQLTTPGNNEWVLAHIAVTNGKTKKYFGLFGQAVYTNTSDLKANAEDEIRNIKTSLELAEMLYIGSIVIKVSSTSSNSYGAYIEQPFDANQEYYSYIGVTTDVTATQVSHDRIADVELAKDGVRRGHLDANPQSIAGTKTFTDGVIANWTTLNNLAVRTTATTITVPGKDVTFLKGKALKVKGTSTAYAFVVNATFSTDTVLEVSTEILPLTIDELQYSDRIVLLGGNYNLASITEYAGTQDFLAQPLNMSDMYSFYERGELGHLVGIRWYAEDLGLKTLDPTMQVQVVGTDLDCLNTALSISTAGLHYSKIEVSNNIVASGNKVSFRSTGTGSNDTGYGSIDGIVIIE